MVATHAWARSTPLPSEAPVAAPVVGLGLEHYSCLVRIGQRQSRSISRYYGSQSAVYLARTQLPGAASPTLVCLKVMLQYRQTSAEIPDATLARNFASEYELLCVRPECCGKAVAHPGHRCVHCDPWAESLLQSLFLDVCRCSSMSVTVPRCLSLFVSLAALAYVKAVVQVRAPATTMQCSVGRALDSWPVSPHTPIHP